jgi:two-component system, chemotaxis family, sensor histidine kinase and response regulator WspE
MSLNSLESLDNHSMSDLFRMEVETQSAILTDCLLGMERDPGATHRLQDMMRAAHSLKGAARIVGRDAAVQVAHSMEDCIVAVQNQKLALSDRHVDALLAGVDLLGRIAQVPEEALDSWGGDSSDGD